jgi:hypothetical protein
MRTEAFDTPGKVRLELSLPSGEIDLETEPGTTTTVELEVHGRDAEEHEREAQIELRQRGERYEVVVSARNRGFSLRGRDYRVRVVMPNEADVEAKVASADIEGRGSFGDVRIQTASGDIELEHVQGTARIDCASGDVHIERADTLKLNSASGDVVVDDLQHGGDVNTASGDVELRSVREGTLKLNSASGDIGVGIATGSRLWVEAQSLSGDTSSELELESGEVIDDDGPLVELNARTLSGDINVRRA